MKQQPLSAPNDIQRYFVTPEESGELCLLAAIYGDNLDVFFPKLSESLHLTRFSEIAERFLNLHGLEAVECDSEQEARKRAGELRKQGKWPCYFFKSDTTGEKDFEEFYTSDEDIDWKRFKTIGVIRNTPVFDARSLQEFEAGISELLQKGGWTKTDLLGLYHIVLPYFRHLETGKYLDERM
jgi:FlaA1/EpsC-like NDP-sugar epimerase